MYLVGDYLPFDVVPLYPGSSKMNTAAVQGYTISTIPLDVHWRSRMHSSCQLSCRN